MKINAEKLNTEIERFKSERDNECLLFCDEYFNHGNTKDCRARRKSCEFYTGVVNSLELAKSMLNLYNSGLRDIERDIEFTERDLERESTKYLQGCLDGFRIVKNKCREWAHNET